MADKKDTTAKTYTAMASQLGATYDDYFRQVVEPEAERFLNNVTAKGHILDAGCGTGTHSLYFQEQGYRVTAIDLSPGMVSASKERGVDAQIMDLEDLKFADHTFDGIWAHTSLIHLPAKDHVSQVVEKFSQILKAGSPLFIALREGGADQWELYHDDPDSKRWFLYFREGELEKYLPAELKVERVVVTEFKGRKFLNYHLRNQK